MDQVQQIYVADHIHDLENEAAALRAERARDVRAARPGVGTGPRRRLGRLLIDVGQAIAGGSAKGVRDSADPMARPA